MKILRALCLDSLDKTLTQFYAPHLVEKYLDSGLTASCLRRSLRWSASVPQCWLPTNIDLLDKDYSRPL